MPRYAFLSVDLRCKECGTPVTDMLWFRWGYCPSSQPLDVYEVGDEIRWRSEPNGVTPGWHHFKDGTVNVGEPDWKDLIATDISSFSVDHGGRHRRCEECGQILWGAAIEIREGRIVRVWLHDEREFDSDIDIYLIRGQMLVAVQEWVGYHSDPPTGC